MGAKSLPGPGGARECEPPRVDTFPGADYDGDTLDPSASSPPIPRPLPPWRAPAPAPGRASRLAARLGLLIALGASACGTGGEDPGPAPRPNIVVYLVDTLRADHLGTYGYERETDPQLARIAADGIVFENNYAPSSWTKASTTSVLTGLDPVQHQVRGRDEVVPDDVALVSEHLQGLGYYTAAVVTNPFVGNHFGFKQGYDEFHSLGRVPAHESFEVVQEVYAGLPKDRPWLLYVHIIDPHGPYDPPGEHWKAYTDQKGPVVGPDDLAEDDPPAKFERVQALYDAEILYQDGFLGRFADLLREDGTYDDCMFWFTSDHGDEFREHGRTGHGRQLFNEVVDVPLLLKLPGNRHAGARVTHSTSLIDVVPTILAHLRAEVPAESDGLDLVELVEGATPERTLYFDLDLTVEDLYVSRGVLLDRYKYIREVYPEDREFLFDVRSDPRELNNLIEAEPDVAELLRARLGERRFNREASMTLTFVGPDDSSQLEARAVLRTDGRFTAVEEVGNEEGDVVRLQEGGQEVEVRLLLAEHETLAGGMVHDFDTVVVRMDPVDARVRVETVQIGPVGGPFEEAGLYLGADHVPSSFPLDSWVNDPAVLSPHPALIFRDERLTREMPPPGLYVAALPFVDAQEIENMPEDVRAQLEALGYLGHGHD